MKIVAATDGSLISRRALIAAMGLIPKLCVPAELHVVAVVDYVTAPGGLGKAPVMAPDLLAGEAETALEVARETAAEMGVPIETHILRGHVVQEILGYAMRIGADMIVIGTHGRRGIVRSMLGSACEQVVRESPIPVLTVHAAA